MKLLFKYLLLAVTLTTVQISVTESKRHREEDSKQCSSDICNLGDKCVLKCFCDIRLNVTDCFLFNGNISSTSEIWETFSPKPYLQTLSLKVTGTGSLKEIPTRAIQRLDGLHNLTIKFAPIKRLTYNAFANSKSLLEIYLIGNQISKLDAFSISRLPNLVTLNLEENEISELEEDVFVYLPSLKKLSLSFNNLTIIHEGCFKNLTQLLELNLHANDISTLTRENFQGLMNLQTLDLSRNELKMLGSYVFAETKYLKNLLLGENKLEMISEMAFNGLARLERLSLENNKIQFLDPRLFQRMQWLTSVDLRYNHLRNLTNETVSPVIFNIIKFDKGALRIDGNHLACDCGLSWVYQIQKTTRNDELRQCVSNITCYADSQLARRLAGILTTQPPRQMRGKTYTYENAKNHLLKDDTITNQVKDDDNMYQDEGKIAKRLLEIPVEILPCPYNLRAKENAMLEPKLNEVRNDLSSTGVVLYVSIVTIPFALLTLTV